MLTAWKDRQYIADWCNGNTGDFDSPIRDSSSLSAAIVAKT